MAISVWKIDLSYLNVNNYLFYEHRVDNELSEWSVLLTWDIYQVVKQSHTVPFKNEICFQKQKVTSAEKQKLDERGFFSSWFDIYVFFAYNTFLNYIMLQAF